MAMDRLSYGPIGRPRGVTQQTIEENERQLAKQLVHSSLYNNNLAPLPDQYNNNTYNLTGQQRDYYLNICRQAYGNHTASNSTQETIEMAETVKTPIGVLSFPNLFVARAPVPGADPRFSLNLVFDKTAQSTEAYKALAKAIWAAGEAQFGAKVFVPGKGWPAGYKNPIRSCTEKADWAGYGAPDAVFISAWTKSKPGLVDASSPPREITVADDVWAGQLARASVAPFGFNQSGNKGVGLMLNNVQITKAEGMERLDGRKSATAEFDDGTGPTTDDDDMPF
jgi:hypothetical protein